MLITGLGIPLVLSSGPAGADQVSSLRARAAAIATQIQAENTRLQILDENYLQAQAKVASLRQQVSSATKAMTATKHSLGRDEHHLQQVAIAAYVGGGENASLSLLMNGSQQNASMQQAYLQAASGNLDESMATVRIAQHQIQGQRAELQRAESAATANARRSRTTARRRSRSPPSCSRPSRR